MNNGRIENLTGPNRERGRDELNRSGMYRVFRYNIEQRSSDTSYYNILGVQQCALRTLVIYLILINNSNWNIDVS